MRTSFAPLAALLCAATALPALAADAVRGKALYAVTNNAPLSCATASCHGPDPSLNINKVRLGANPAVILAALDSVSIMTFMKPYVSTIDASDIAAYIANPAAGTPAPTASLSTTTLNFGDQVLQTRSATMSATLSNSGTANLVLGNIAMAGTHAADFARSGTCAAAMTLAPSQSCSLQFSFQPAALGARAATLTVNHNASPASSTVMLAGTGVSAPAPAVGLSAMSVAFGNQTIGATSAARTMSISNTGSATLILGTIAPSGAQASEFAATGCSGASLAPGASCAVSITFTPSALSTRSATLAIASNASGSPHGVALSGTGVAAPAPAIALNPAMVAFGNQTVGATSAPRTIALTNTGSAALAISAITASGNGFAATHNCPSMLAAGANCTISTTFSPAAATGYSGAVTVTSSAAGSPHGVAVNGTGVAPTPTAPAAMLAPLAVDFGGLPLNTVSGVRTLTLTNNGNAPLTLTALNLGGPASADFSRSSNCPVGGALAAGASCTISVTFTPSVAGPRAASLAVSSNAAGAPTVELRGTGLVQAAAQAQLSPGKIKFKRLQIGRSDEHPVRIRNTGSTSLAIGPITMTGDFAHANGCPAMLAAGASCELRVRFQPTALGKRVGELSIASNAAGSPHQVTLSGTGVAARAEEDCDEEKGCGQSMSPFGGRRR